MKDKKNNNKNIKEINNKENNDDFYPLNPEDIPRHSYSFTSTLYNNRMNYQHDTFQRKYIGQFVLSQKLGQGTFGIVVLATHQITGEKVAVKILEKERILQEADKTRIEREIKILKNMRHNNIVHLYDIKETPSSLYIIMEYISGKELFEYIISKKRLSELEACNFYQQIISGIEYLGKIRVVHRDLKPENLLLDEHKNIKIVDFGLSNIYPNNELLRTACGSPCYAAPEMINGEPYIGLRVDIWSSGIVLFAMLCGYLPFEDADNEILYKKITAGKFKSPKFLSDYCKDFLNRILNVNPDKRYTIEQIKNHPWFNIINPKINMSEGLLLHVYIVPIDDKIIEEMVNNLKFNEEEVRANLIANNHNHTTTTYYLLLEKKLREGQKSICDMKSKEFSDYLKNPANLLSTYGYNLSLIIQLRIRKNREYLNQNNDENNNSLNKRTRSGVKANDKKSTKYKNKQNSEGHLTPENKNSNEEIKIKTIFNKKKTEMKKRVDYTRRATNNKLLESKDKMENDTKINNFKKIDKIKKKNKKELTKENINQNIKNSNSNNIINNNDEQKPQNEKKIKEYEIVFNKKKKEQKEEHEHSTSYTNYNQEEKNQNRLINGNTEEKNRDYSFDINNKNSNNNKKPKAKKTYNQVKPKRTITNTLMPKTSIEKRYNFKTIGDRNSNYTSKGSSNKNKNLKTFRENTDLNLNRGLKKINNINNNKINQAKDKKGFVKIAELMGRMRVINNIKEMSQEPKDLSHDNNSKDGIYYILTDKEKVNKGSTNTNNDKNINIKDNSNKNKEKELDKNRATITSNNSNKLVKNLMQINSFQSKENKDKKIKKNQKVDKTETKERKTREQKEVNKRTKNKKGFFDTSVSFDKSHDGVRGRDSTKPKKISKIQSEKKKINLNVKNKKKEKNFLITDEAHHIEEDSSSSSSSEKINQNKDDEIKRKEKDIKYLKLKSKNKKFITVKKEEESNINNNMNINSEKEMFKIRNNNNSKHNEKNIMKRNRLENTTNSIKNYTNFSKNSNLNDFNTIVHEDLNKTEKGKNGKTKKKIKTLNTQGNLIKKLTIQKNHLHSSLNDSKRNMFIKRTHNSNLNDKMKSFNNNNENFKSIEDIFYKTCVSNDTRQVFPIPKNFKKRDDDNEFERKNNEFKESKIEVEPFDLDFIFMNNINDIKNSLKEITNNKKWKYKIKKNGYLVYKNDNQIEFEFNKINNENNLYIIRVVKRQGNYLICKDIIKYIINKIK